MTHLLAGFATVDWTPEPGLRLLGQMHQRIAQYERDPLQAVACALKSDDLEIVLVCVDVCMLDNEFIADVRAEWESLTGGERSVLLVHTTHTHVAPVVTSVVMEEAEPVAVAAVRQAVLEAGSRARRVLQPVQAFAGNGYCEQLGWNRRAMFADGTTRMYGNVTQEGFIGLEGPRDGTVPVISFKNLSGEVVGVLTGFAMHPNCVEGAEFYSADFPGAVRRNVRRLVGEQATVLYFTGPAGDTAPSILDVDVPGQEWRGEAGVERSGLYFAGEVAKVLAMPAEPMAPVLAWAGANLEIPMREWPKPGEPTYSLRMNDYYRKAEAGWTELVRKESPFAVNLHAVRIGDAVLATNPGELFVQFGLEMRESSPASTMLLAQLTDGYCGYVPTKKAFERGGYETWCAPSSRLDFGAGEMIVEGTVGLISGLFGETEEL